MTALAEPRPPAIRTAHPFVWTPPDPPLPGVPRLAVKDNVDVAGAPTAAGGTEPLTRRADRHATAVGRLVAAGFAVVGKTAMVELAYGGWGTNRAAGAPANPWDAAVDRTCGGSSSGSGAAVAAGLADVAVGTDTGGSVRIPAALCGVVGLKPSMGVVPTDGVVPLAPSLDTVGPLARSVAEAAAALAWMAGRPPFEAVPLRGLKVAVPAPDALGALDPAVAAGFEAARLWLAAEGVAVGPAPIRPEAYVARLQTILGFEAHALWRTHAEARGDAMDAWVRDRVLGGSAVGEAAYRAALAERAPAREAEFAGWNGADALLTPTVPILAPPFDAVDERRLPLSRFTRVANYLDLPAVSVPAGLSPAGLPVAVQLVGRPGGEAAIVGLAAAIERARGPLLRPPRWAGATDGRTS